jgi:hypothetical protein
MVYDAVYTETSLLSREYLREKGGHCKLLDKLLTQ